MIRVVPVSPSNSSDERSGTVHFDCNTNNLTSSDSIVRHDRKKKKGCFTQFCKNGQNQLKSSSQNQDKRVRKILIASSGTFSRTFAKFKRKREMRLLRTLIIILVILVASTVPLGLLFIVSFAETDKRYVLTAKILLTTSLVNSMVNPWVYFWRFIEMRRALKKMFSKCF